MENNDYEMEQPNDMSGEAPQEPAERTEPNETPVSENGTYRNAGVGRQESPYANSPYDSPYTASHTNNAPGYDAPKPCQDPPQDQKKRHKASGKGTWKKIVACAATVAVVAGSCGLTAWGVNRHWEDRTQQMEEQFQSQINKLQTQIAASGNSGISVSGTGTADGLSPSQVYAQNVNSVVAVSNYQVISDRWTGGNGTEQLAGTGSGFIISDDGYVMTNCHVVDGASRLTITTFAGDEYEATLVGSDEINDVALLKVDATGLDAVEIGSSDDLLVGDMVVAIGNPLGELTSTATFGYISGKDRSVSTDGTIINMLQTDAAINSGNSGGPLFNMKGQVVGITTAKYSGSTNSGAYIEGIGFAIPIDDVLGMIDDFKEYGYLRNQAYLGVTVRDMSAYASSAEMFSLPMGSYVQSVVEGGCAEKAGVQPQDIIIGLGDYEIDGNTSLTTTLRRFSAGETTTITVYRAGAELELEITFDERPQNVSSGDTQPTESGEMPDTGSYDEWYDYFRRHFGIQDNEQP